MEVQLALTLVLAAPSIMAWESLELDGSQNETWYENKHSKLRGKKEDQDVMSSNLRFKRTLGQPEEIMDTAEQVVFNPFYHRHTYQNPQKREDISRVSAPHTYLQQGSVPQVPHNYIFRGTPFGAVFVKHQSDAYIHHKQKRVVKL